MDNGIILLIIAGVSIIVLALLLPKKKASKTTKDYSNEYKPKYVLTTNEKRAFQIINEVTNELCYTVLAKVRLYDLIEPKDRNNKGARWKIQAKHVDYVICDKNLIARYIIELNDNSHNREDRKERDEFITTALRNCGYKVLNTKYIEKERLLSWIREQEN